MQRYIYLVMLYAFEADTGRMRVGGASICRGSSSVRGTGLCIGKLEQPKSIVHHDGGGVHLGCPSISCALYYLVCIQY